MCTGRIKSATNIYDSITNFLKSYFENVWNTDLNSSHKMLIPQVVEIQQEILKKGVDEQKFVDVWWTNAKNVPIRKIAR